MFFVCVYLIFFWGFLKFPDSIVFAEKVFLSARTKAERPFLFLKGCNLLFATFSVDKTDRSGDRVPPQILLRKTSTTGIGSLGYRCALTVLVDGVLCTGRWSNQKG